MRFAFVSARSQLFLVGALLVATIGIADMVLIHMQHDAAIDSYDRSLSNLAEGYANSLSHFLGLTEVQLAECGGAVLAHATTPPAGVSLAQRRSDVGALLENCSKSLQSGPGAAIYDADGHLFASSRPWPLAARDVAREDFFEAIKNAGVGYRAISRPVAGSQGGIATYVGLRLTNLRGQFVGASVIELSLNGLEDYYKSAMPAHRILMYARNDGVILMHSPHIDGLSGTVVQPGSPWYASRDGGGVYRVADKVPAKRYFAANRKVPGWPMCVEVSALESEVLADAEQRKPWMIAIGLVASAIVLLLLRTVAAHLTRVENARRALERTQAQLQATLGNVSQGVCFFGNDQRLLVSNRQYAQIHGLTPDSVRPGMSLFEIIDMCRAAGTAPLSVPEGGEAAALAALLAAGDCHFDVQLQDGRVIAMQQRCMPDGGWVATHEDITARRRAETEINFLASHDSLTGLANRAMFQDAITRAIAEIERGAHFTILFLDLDRFKAVNDTLGHKAGDELLQAVARRLAATVRKTDIVARFGGDEFAILQLGSDSGDGAKHLAGRIIRSLSAPYDLEDATATIGVSIGIAFGPGDGRCPVTLLKHADTALYLAKSEGRGTFRFFEPEMNVRLMRRHEIERDLRTAIAEEQFELHYQPVINIASGAVVGFEALIRWNHPEKGFMAPSEFIGVAEDCGLITQIGAWVLRQACRQATRWPNNIHIAVNLSPVQFRSASLVEMVAGELAQCGLAAGRLQLEITESVILDSNDANIATLHRLRDLGVSIAMDDFGVGYSSLSYLHCFPFDRIKIDRSFVTNMITRREPLFIVRAILGLCRDLNVQTTVEGVETAEQLAILSREKASDVQGYFFSRPLPAQKLAAFLANWRSPLLAQEHKKLAAAVVEAAEI